MTEQKDKIREDIELALATNQTANIIDLLKQIPTPYFSYDCREDKKKYPKAFEDIKAFLISNSNGAIDDLEDDQLEMAIFVNPRMLYDYFDNKQMMISIIQEEDFCYFKIDNQKVKHISESFPNRHKTEQNAFSKAFSYVEKYGKA